MSLTRESACQAGPGWPHARYEDASTVKLRNIKQENGSISRLINLSGSSIDSIAKAQREKTEGQGRVETGAKPIQKLSRPVPIYLTLYFVASYEIEYESNEI